MMIEYAKQMKSAHDKAVAEEGVISANITWDGRAYLILQNETFEQVSAGYPTEYSHNAEAFHPHWFSCIVDGIEFKAAYTEPELLARYDVEVREADEIKEAV